MKENIKKYLLISASAIISFALIMKLKKMFSKESCEMLFPSTIKNSEKELIKNLLNVLDNIELDSRFSKGIETFKKKIIKGEYCNNDYLNHRMILVHINDKMKMKFSLTNKVLAIFPGGLQKIRFSVDLSKFLEKDTK